MLRIDDLAGKSILITGASSGIGAAISRAFAEQGARLALHKWVDGVFDLNARAVIHTCQAAFLASRALSGYITGQNIHVNGGQVMP
jgi:NAD(P)-dependent dehydrogenase (short-subunit alcohol dehydrogenase family)